MSRPFMEAWWVVEATNYDRALTYRVKDVLKYEGPTVRSALKMSQKRALDHAQFMSRQGDYQFRVAAVGVDKTHWGRPDEI